MKHGFAHEIFVLLAVGLAIGCGGPPAGDADATPPGAAGAARDEARTLAIPGEELPPDHPPLSSSTAGSRLAWEVPAGWETQPPATRMRIAQYRVPGPGGDAECIVFYFGPGQGGDALANARRWAGQFTGPDGQSAVETMTITELDSAAVPVQLVEVKGTYDGGMTMTAAPPERQTGFMLLGSIAQGSDAPWFFKLTGPEATVLDQRGAFVQMMDSIRPEE